ncbi:hypothetical protein [Acrocarpospora sp. B8E8]|uniref:hypothetical protein n=1 Tax=Acrocarpospora sp. B8E8 TaxID=3153572 RepID=UPI00325EB71A
MRTWSDSPFERTVPLSQINRYTDADVISRDNGESYVIFEPPGHEGWLVKLYKPDLRVDHGMLRRLIELPGTMPPADLARVDDSVAWPVARVLDGYRTVGTVMAKATQEFSWDIALLGGRTKRRLIEIDHLANLPQRQRQLGFPVPDSEQRLNAVRNMVACAALFERHDVVYADWSFANAFWSPRTQQTLIIDVDAAGLGQRRFVETPNWEDPLMDPGRPVTTHTDRYKVALLVARVMTGHRQGHQPALAEMERQYPAHTHLIETVRRALSAMSAEARPTLAELQQAVENPGGVRRGAPASGGDNVRTMRVWTPPAKPSSAATVSFTRQAKPGGPSPPPPAPPSRPRPSAHFMDFLTTALALLAMVALAIAVALHPLFH